MTLDLSALDTDLNTTSAEANGKPLELFLYDVMEDPDQPRVEFPEEEMLSIAESIKQRGVKTPISVKPHPKELGKWIINHGARRYRGSLMAGKEKIPAFIDSDHDDYDQVMENKERLNHTPIEMALFIKKKIDQGEKKGVIAKKLNEEAVYITTHLALIDMPEAMLKAYEAGCKSPKTLYDLRGLFDKFESEVEAWILKCLDDGKDITRASVQALSKELKAPKKATDPIETLKDLTAKAEEVVNKEKTVDEESSYHEDNHTLDLGEEHDVSGVCAVKADKVPENANGEEIEPIAMMDESNLADSKPVKEQDPNKIKKPLVCVLYDDRQASLILDKKPTSLGFAWIKFEDGTEQSVDCELLKIEYLKGL